MCVIVYVDQYRLYDFMNDDKMCIIIIIIIFKLSGAISYHDRFYGASANSLRINVQVFANDD